jgi:hypothetical protein
VKKAEEKMWDSFRDSEGRERVLRKELHKMQKVKTNVGSFYRFIALLRLQLIDYNGS